MKINEKIKRIRELKGWSQEQMAEKLNMSISGYANIERGETNVQFSRLEQISKILEIKLSELIDLDEKNIQIFLLQGNGNIENHLITIQSSDTHLKHELEKAHLLLQERNKEINYLKQQVEHLKELLALLKKD